MKKLLSIIFCIVLIFAFTACKGKNKAPANKFEIVDKNKTVWLTENDVASVTRGYDPVRGYSVIINTTENGKTLLNKATSSNVGENIDLVICGEVIYSPLIVDTITDGSFEIDGFKSEDEMSELYNSLKQIN